jgi:hypothetical protein
MARPSPSCAHNDDRLRLSAASPSQNSEAGKKESTVRRLSQLCPPCATPSSNSSLDHRRSVARIVENAFAANSGVSKSAKVVLGRAAKWELSDAEKASGRRMSRHLAISLKALLIPFALSATILANGSYLSEVINIDPNSILFRLWPFNHVFSTREIFNDDPIHCFFRCLFDSFCTFYSSGPGGVQYARSGLFRHLIQGINCGRRDQDRYDHYVFSLRCSRVYSRIRWIRTSISDVKNARILC